MKNSLNCVGYWMRSATYNCWYLYYGANARDNITLLRTLAGPDGTGYDRCLHVSIVVRIVRRRGIKFVVVIVAVHVVAQGAAVPAHAPARVDVDL